MTQIGKACDVIPGKTPAKAAYTSVGDIKVIKFRDVLKSGAVDYTNDEEGWFDSRYADELDLVDLRPGTILMTNAAHTTEYIGKKVALVETVPSIANRVCYVGELTGIRSHVPEYSTRWIYYWLQTIDARRAIIRAVEGAHLIPTKFKRINLPTISTDHQTTHLTVLSRIDDAIANAMTELEAVWDLKRVLETGLLTGQLDNRARAKAATKAGVLPTGWQVEQLKKVAIIDSGVTLNQDRAPKEYPCRYLTVAHVQRGKVLRDDPRYLELTPQERESRLLRDGDVLVVEGHASSLEIGRAGMYEDNGEATTFQNHLFRIRPDVNLLLPKYLLYILNSVRVQRYWNAICNTSSGLNTINRRNLRNVLIQLPEVDEQREIVCILEAAEANIQTAEQKINALDEVKRSLLQNLFTGKIRIPEGVLNG